MWGSKKYANMKAEADTSYTDMVKRGNNSARRQVVDYATIQKTPLDTYVNTKMIDQRKQNILLQPKSSSTKSASLQPKSAVPSAVVTSLTT